MGIVLPNPATPAANYVPAVQTGSLVYIAGQVPFHNGELHYRGKLGAEISLEEGQKAARLVALNVLAQLKAALDGDLDRVMRCVKLTGYVNCTPEFDQPHAVLNGASDLLVQIFGAHGRHARVAVGANSLPFNVAIEIEGLFEVR